MDGSGASLGLAELTHVQDLARKLNGHLNPSQIEFCRSVTQEILFSIEKAISTVKSMHINGRGQPVPILHHQFNDKERHMSRKRKMLPKWTNQVSVSVAGGAEVPPDDGHSWRKYGQKDILGAKYPRAYYRCTHRKTKGCSAMKQVQRSEENTSVFDVTYLGTHTCSSSWQQTASISQLNEPQQSLLDQQNNLAQQYDFQTSLQVKTENSYTENQDPTTSFSFSSTPIVDGTKPENELFCTNQNMEFDYVGSLSSTFASPTTSGSNCLPLPPCEMNSEGDPELAEIISVATSATDSPIMDVEFMLEYGVMVPDMHFDTSIFFA